MSKKFKQLLVPEGYRHYWSKYPEGYTILEALLNWVDSVNQLTDNVNDWNIYLEDFVENFDEKLAPTVREMLNEMDQDGRLAEIINDEIFSWKADITYVDTELDKKADKTYVDTELDKKADKTEIVRMDKKLIEVDDRSFYNNLTVHKKPKALITILDDDTRNELYDVIYPIIQELNVPITAAAITGRIGVSEATITLEQYKEMNQSGFVEFISHTVNHDNLTNLTLEEAEIELAESKRWLIENGGNPDYFVPPFGGANDELRELIRKYYKASYQTMSVNYVVTPPLNTYAIRRSNFDVESVSLETQKTRLDEALSSNGWIILNTHSQYPGFKETDFREIINYAKSIGLEFVTISEGMKHFGNILDIDSDPTSEEYSLIDSIGRTYGKIDSKSYMIDRSNVTSDLAITDKKFREGVNICYFTGALANNYGWPTAGILHTIKTGSTNYAYQRFIYFGQAVELLRHWTGTGWSEWVNVSGNERKSNTQITTEFISDIPVGHCVYNSTLQQPIWWAGDKWVDGTGSGVTL